MAMNALLDTNILVDYLNGVPKAQQELKHYSNPCISAISWMEVMVGCTDKTEEGTRAFLRGFAVVPVDEAVMELAVTLRRDYKLKLPDAIIWASAKSRGLLLITRNTKDFPAKLPGIRVPYTL
jgi:predicted nucleic acid-binding protein